MKKIFEKIKRKKPKKRMVWIFFVVVTFVVGLGSSVFIYNYQQRNRNTNLEITFLDPHQAIVFWNTRKKTISFVKYGESESDLTEKIYQTSSVPGTVHAVVIENIPLEGGYITLHNESDSPFLFSQTERIVFDAQKYIE